MRISDWSSDVCSSDLPRLPEVEEHLLLVAVIVGIAGRDLAAPVERKTHGFELAAHRGDVFRRPGGGMHLVLEGGVLGRQEIGRASCRERVCQYVLMSVVAVSLKKKRIKI